MVCNSTLSGSRSRLLRWLSLFAILGATELAVAGCPDADAEALQWLDKMSRSLRQSSYEGVITLQRNGDIQTVQVSHAVNDGSSVERMTELTGQGAQVERAPHSMDCIHPGDQLLRISELAAADRCGIAKLYRFRMADEERIAGRNAVNIRIKPRDLFRFGYVVALDRQTGLLLKMQTIGKDNQTLETMQFAHLSYTDAVPYAGEAAVVHQAQHPQPDDSATHAFVSRPWIVGWLPPGFAATDSPPGTSGRRTYTDGLAVFSVFLEELARAYPNGEGLVRQGGTVTYSRGRHLDNIPVLVTVIGEIPVNTARIVAESVSWE